jgi:hypothetical protein
MAVSRRVSPGLGTRGALLDLRESDRVGAAPGPANGLLATVARPIDPLLELGDLGVDRVDLLGVAVTQAPADPLDAGGGRLGLGTVSEAEVSRPRAVVPLRTMISTRLRSRRPVASMWRMRPPPTSPSWR